jgi:murein DD-endopeptidase MepM/ murein hydrolase activator NlpD
VLCGQRLSRQYIAVAGSTGNSTGPVFILKLFVGQFINPGMFYHKARGFYANEKDGWN